MRQPRPTANTASAPGDTLPPDEARCPVEEHPLAPFTPANAKVLMLGSFPPPRRRWCMEFYYPNPQNDFWRITGQLFFDDKEHFVIPGERRFNREQITEFLARTGIALYDTASAVRRLLGNASDDALEIVRPAPIARLLQQMPQCHTLAATGGLAAQNLGAILGAPVPPMGSSTHCHTATGAPIQFWRMPSSSRAYPLAFAQKCEHYQRLYTAAGLL